MIHSRLPSVALFALVMVVSGGKAVAQTPAAPAPVPAVPRVLDLLEATGLNYQKNTPTSWVVHFEGKTGNDIPIVLAQTPDILVVVSIVAVAADVRASLALYRELLVFNIDVDYVKVGIDDDGDYQVRSELALANATAPTLRALFDQVANSTDQLKALFAKHKK